MMQRLLFGPHRRGLPYQDLRAAELSYFSALLLFIALLSFTPAPSLHSSLARPEAGRAEQGRLSWLK
jgi:hypothetical protein